MRLFIDADGCPVVRLASDCARRHGSPVTLVSLIQPGDAVVTQDYGLAAMCLARRAVALNQNGMIYTDGNIDSLLLARHTARKLRNAGVRLKGPSKRTREQDDSFAAALEALFSGS